MAGEDLLDERRARARESDDEDRCPARIAAASALREEAAVEKSADASAARLEAPAVESRVEAAQSVAARVVREGLAILPALLERPAHGEMQLCHLASRALSV